MTSKIVVNNIEADAGISSVTLVSNIAGEDSTQNISGINSVTATTYYGNGASLTGIDASTLKHNNNTKAQATASGVTITGNLGVSGVLTYEDVTNVDSIGIVTARSGVKIGPSAGVAGTFFPDGSYVTAGIITASNLSGTTTIGGSPANPAPSAQEIKAAVSGTPDNGWYWIKDFGNIAYQHYCVFKNKAGNDIAGGPWVVNFVAGVNPTFFSATYTTAKVQYINLCKQIGIDQPGRGMESSRTTAEVHGAWLASKRAIWEMDPGFFDGASSAGGGVMIMPMLNINNDGGSSDQRLVYNDSATHLPANQDGDHCTGSQLFCGWWGGNDYTSWATDNDNLPGPEDWGVSDAAHTGAIGARSHSNTVKPSWRFKMLVNCIYR